MNRYTQRLAATQTAASEGKYAVDLIRIMQRHTLKGHYQSAEILEICAVLWASWAATTALNILGREV